MARISLAVIFLFVNQLVAQHSVKLEISEIEWNGKIKILNPIRVFEEVFTSESRTFLVDSFNGKALYGKFIYQPIYNDTSEKPAFNFLFFDSSKRVLDVSTLTEFKPGKYDAGIKVKDEFGQRRWVGKLRYKPDTSVHLERPYWRKDNYTLQIESFRAWNAETSLKGNNNNKVIKDLYFQGTTSVKTELKPGGKYGDENFYMQIDPIRYQWGNEIWMEIVVHLFKKQNDGQYLEVLAHTFKSTDKNIFYNGVRKQNAYEIRDAKNKYYMLITGVLIIPY